MIKLVAKELRRKMPTKEELAKIKRNPIFLVLDEVINNFVTKDKQT